MLNFNLKKFILVKKNVSLQETFDAIINLRFASSSKQGAVKTTATSGLTTYRNNVSTSEQQVIHKGNPKNYHITSEKIM